MGALSSWRFCPRCGAELAHDDGRVECAGCGFVHYANPVPAVSALVLDDEGRILLARRALEPGAGLWDTPGGFLDEGEAPEDGLRRELREEAGVDVELGDFVGIFGDLYGDDEEAPFVLNLVWRVEIVRGEPEPADDVAELRWFDHDELPRDDELAFDWIRHALREGLPNRP